MDYSPEDARDAVSAIIRRPWYFAVLSGVVVIVAIVLLFRSAKLIAGASVMLVIAGLIFQLSVLQVTSVSTVALSRLKIAAEELGGRYTLFRAGRGEFASGPFKHGGGHARFGILNAVVNGRPIEIGHLTSEPSGARNMPIGLRSSYFVISLPSRLPNMSIPYGGPARFFGMRPSLGLWHRSQLVDIGGGRRFRLFVADEGESIARAFFTPEMMRVFQRVGRDYGVEFKGDHLYLFSRRSVAAGSRRRWQRQQALVEELTVALEHSGIWEHLQGFHRGRGPVDGELTVDDKRLVKIVVWSAVIAFVVLTTVALYLREIGLLKV